MVSAPSCAATLTDAAWIPARFDASTARSHIIIMGMSRSGSSLTSSLVSEVLLGRTPQSWRGSGAPLPADGANPLGYYERRDVVSLNYELIRALGHPHWSSFAPTHARCPSTPNLTHTLASTSKWPTLEARMRAIVDDMNTFSPWLLKDVRFRSCWLWVLDRNQIHLQFTPLIIKSSMVFIPQIVVCLPLCLSNQIYSPRLGHILCTCDTNIRYNDVARAPFMKNPHRALLEDASRDPR